MIPVYLFTDSESTLESVASTKQISTKTLKHYCGLKAKMGEWRNSVQRLASNDCHVGRHPDEGEEDAATS